MTFCLLFSKDLRDFHQYVSEKDLSNKSKGKKSLPNCQLATKLFLLKVTAAISPQKNHFQNQKKMQ